MRQSSMETAGVATGGAAAELAKVAKEAAGEAARAAEGAKVDTHKCAKANATGPLCCKEACDAGAAAATCVECKAKPTCADKTTMPACKVVPTGGAHDPALKGADMWGDSAKIKAMRFFSLQL